MQATQPTETPALSKVSEQNHEWIYTNSCTLWKRCFMQKCQEGSHGTLLVGENANGADKFGDAPMPTADP